MYWMEVLADPISLTSALMTALTSTDSPSLKREIIQSIPEIIDESQHKVHCIFLMAILMSRSRSLLLVCKHWWRMKTTLSAWFLTHSQICTFQKSTWYFFERLYDSCADSSSRIIFWAIWKKSWWFQRPSTWWALLYILLYSSVSRWYSNSSFQSAQKSMHLKSFNRLESSSILTGASPSMRTPIAKARRARLLRLLF